MKRKLLFCTAVLAAIVLAISAVSTASHINRSASFFHDVTVLSIEQLNEFMPSYEYLVFVEQYETDDFFVELMAFRDETQRVAVDREIDGIRFLWRIEPRGNTRLHRYDFRLWQPPGLLWETDEDRNRLFIHYGDRVVDKQSWPMVSINFPAQYWNGIWPTSTRVDSVLIWGEAFVPIEGASIEDMLIRASLSVHRRNREVLNVTHEWSVLSQDS